jgi:hypothetical protein
MFYLHDVLTCVVWVLESVTYTCQLSAWVYTHLHDMGEFKKKPWYWYRTLVLNFFEKKKKKEKNTFLTTFLTAGSVLGKGRKELDYGI